MRATVLLNEKAGTLAGNGRLRGDEVQRLFAENGVVAAVQILPAEDLVGFARAVVHAEPGTPVVVGGGDGTVSSVAAVARETQTPLGVLPLGTLNHFAKDLGLPIEPAAAVRTIAAGQLRAVDAGSVNGRLFLNNCSVGAYPEAVRRREILRRVRGHGKAWAMLLAALDGLRNLRRLRVQLATESASFVRRTPFVLVSNNRYSRKILSQQLRPRLDEGMLCTYSTRVHRVLPLLRLTWRALCDGLEDLDGLDVHVSRQVRLELSALQLPVAIDGEVAPMQPPLELAILPGALRVFAPPAPHA